MTTFLKSLNTHKIANAGSAAGLAAILILVDPGMMASFLATLHIHATPVQAAMFAAALGAFLSRYGRPETVPAG